MPLVFVQNAFLCFSLKTGSEVVSRKARDLELPAKVLKGNKFFDKSHRNFCDYLANNSFSQNVVWPKLDFFQI